MSNAKLVGVADLQHGYSNVIAADISAELHDQLGKEGLNDISRYHLPIISQYPTHSSDGRNTY